MEGEEREWKMFNCNHQPKCSSSQNSQISGTHGRPTSVHSCEDALHGMEGGVPARARLSCLVTVSTKVKVVAHQTFVSLARKSTLTTSITAHSYVPGIREKRSKGWGISGRD